MSNVNPELTTSLLGSTTLGTIAGRLTLDADKNNTEETGSTGNWDAGIGGRTIQLLDIAGNVIATTLTDASGTYSFNVAAGQYVVKFPQMTGFVYGAMDQGGYAPADSDAGADGKTEVISLGAGETYVNIDASAQTLPLGSIHGRLTFDSDGNNDEWNATTFGWDVGLAGRTVQLLDEAGKVVATTTTDANGEYYFQASEGQYRVKFAADANTGFVAKDGGLGLWAQNSDVDAFGRSDLLSVKAGQTLSNIDAGIRSTDSGAISGRFFMDENNNSLDDGEIGMAGATVQLWICHIGVGWVVAQETTTDQNGDYSFSGLASNGNYVVRFLNYAPEKFVTANAGNDAIDSDVNHVLGNIQVSGNDGQVLGIAVSAGQHVTNIDAGLVSRGWTYEKISDADAGATVRSLGAELVTNGGFESHTNAGQTGFWIYNTGGVTGWSGIGGKSIELQTGNYATGNRVGNAIVELDNYRGSIDGIQQSITVTEAGTYQLSFDYGVRDYNYAGEQWWADSASNGFMVLIDGKLVQLVGSGVDANFKSGFQHRSFDIELAAGKHTIQFIEDGNGPSIADDGVGAELDNVSLKKVIDTQTTGNASGTFYYDSDRDGQQDANEGGLGGRTVYLLDLNGGFVKDAKGDYLTAQTDPDGHYTFTGLKPAAYRVAFEDTMGNLEFPASNGTSPSGKPVFITDGFRVNPGVEVKGIDGGMVGTTTSRTIEVCENDTFVQDFDTSCELISEDVYFMVDEPICARVGMNSFNENQTNGWNNSTTEAMLYRVFLDKPATSDLTITVRLTVDPAKVGPSSLGYAPDGFAYLTTQSNEINAPRFEELQVTIKAGQTSSNAFYVGTEAAKLNYAFGIEIDEIYNHDQSALCERVSRVVTTPVAIDLNRDGEIGVTGETTSKDKAGLTIGETVHFDMNGDGKAERIEWFDGSGGGILIDNRDGKAATSMNGLRLFGDEGGKYTDGYAKLRALFDSNGDGKISGAELKGLSLWVDDGDAKVEAGEIQTLNSNSITSISGVVSQEVDANGRPIIRSTVSQDFESTGNVAYSLEGADAALFKVDAEGKVSFIKAPDYENPLDHGKDNVYNVTLVRTTADPTCEPSRENLRIEVCDKPSLGDTVWYDTNGDGKLNTGEAGAAGVRVELYAAGTTTLIATTVTDANGKYLFDDLNAGNYQVKFIAPSGYTFTTQAPVGPEVANNDSDANVDTGLTGVINLVDGEHQRNVDAGLVVEDPHTASLGDTVWYDKNKDGVLNNGEAGAGNVKVDLLAGGAVVATTSTDANGNYLFSNLAAGNYQVRFTAPNGYVFTTQSTVAADAVNNDSDANVSTGLTGNINLAIGENERDVDAGLKDPGTARLGDTVFIDVDRNGVQSAADIMLAGVQVTLYDANGIAIGTDTTDSNGKYGFDNLDAGNYSVGFGRVDGFDFIAPNAGPDNLDSDANQTTGRTGTYTLAIGEANLTIDAGLTSKKPVVNHDAAHGCADEDIVADVLANDTDKEPLTITAVAGTPIREGQTIVVGGVNVTLTDGKLVFDGEKAYAGLDIGETAVRSFGYTVSDGLGGVASSAVRVTFCGDANSVQSLYDSLPDRASYQVVSGENQNPFGDNGYDLKISGTGDDRLDDVVFEEAYCLSYFDPLQDGSDFSNAPVLSGNLLSAQTPVAQGVFNPSQTSHFNGQSAAANMDLINWIIAQDFENDSAGSVNGDFNGWEVQFAIWELTDNFVASTAFAQNAGYGDLADTQYILAQAAANGEGFVAGVGDKIGLIVDPDPATPTNAQPYIVALDFEQFDCLC